MEKSLKYRHSKGNNSAITDCTSIKRHVQNITMVIYAQYKFHESSIGYLVMAEDGKTLWMEKPDVQKDGRTTPNQYPSAFSGKNGAMVLWG